MVDYYHILENQQPFYHIILKSSYHALINHGMIWFGYYNNTLLINAIPRTAVVRLLTHFCFCFSFCFSSPLPYYTQSHLYMILLYCPFHPIDSLPLFHPMSLPSYPIHLLPMFHPMLWALPCIPFFNPSLLSSVCLNIVFPNRLQPTPLPYPPISPHPLLPRYQPLPP